MDNKQSIRLRVSPGNTPINPFIYGNFMEFIENHISGMWAEMLTNRKFEDVLQGSSLPAGWEAGGFLNQSLYLLEDHDPFMGRVCARMRCPEDRGGDTAIIQRGIAVEKGRCCIGHVWLKQQGLTSPVMVALGKSYGRFFLPYAEARFDHVSGQWARYDFTLTPDATADAEFSVRFAGTGEVWIDAVSLMPEDNLQGWRRDVVELTRNLKPNILRFPGGCFADTYHWEAAIGERDLRLPRDNRFWSNVPLDYLQSNCRSARHERPVEPNDVGIGEFVAFCRLVGAEPFVCVNLGTGTAEEAARWVEYCNGEVITPMGAARARNGHEQPFDVKYWEIGNEMYGAWETGYAGLEGYIEGYRRFRSAMAAACPAIRFVADGAGAAWNQAVLHELGSMMDCLDVHIYPGISEGATKRGSSAVFEEMRLRITEAENEIARVRGEIEVAGLAGNVKLGVCEYNISGGNWGPDRIYLSTHGNALFCAGMLIAFQKNADIVDICNISNLTNAWWASCIRTNARAAHATAPYHVLAMMSGLCGDRLFSLSGDEAEGFRASASGGEGFVSVEMLNFSAAACDVSLDFADCAGFDDCRPEWTVLAAQPEALNDFESPDRVAPESSKINIGMNANSSVNLTLPPYSFSILRAHLA